MQLALSVTRSYSRSLRLVKVNMPLLDRDGEILIAGRLSTQNVAYLRIVSANLPDGTLTLVYLSSR